LVGTALGLLEAAGRHKTTKQCVVPRYPGTLQDGPITQ
jgi:hypothetical protein